MPDLQHIIHLRTSRIAFLPPSANDLAELYSFFSNPSQAYFLFLPQGTPQQQEDFWVNWNYNHWKNYGFGVCAIRSQGNGALLGMCGVSHQVIDGRKYYEMTCFILPAYQRQGFATEALQTLGDFLTNTTRHSLFNNQFSAQTTTWSTSWSGSATEVDGTEDFVVVVPDHNPAARRVAEKLALTPIHQSKRGNEPVTLGRYLPLSAQREDVYEQQGHKGILLALLTFFVIIPLVSAGERALISYFTQEQVPYFAVAFTNMACVVFSGKIILFFTGTGSLLKFVFSQRARQRADETVLRQFHFWSWLALPVCLFFGFAGGLISGVWDARLLAFGGAGLISGLLIMIAFRLGWFDEFLG